MIALAVEQLERNNIMPCNQPNRQKPGKDYRKEIMAFLELPQPPSCWGWVKNLVI